MVRLLKSLFQQHCPTCNEPLRSQRDALSSVKECPHGHFKEEIYPHLGVSIVYHDSK